MNKSLSDVKLINLPRIEDPRGNLSFIEEENHTAFKIERAYWIYDVPGGQVRGGHAFRKQEELIIAISGSFDVMVDDGRSKKNLFTQPILLWFVSTFRIMETNGKFLNQFFGLSINIYIIC